MARTATRPVPVGPGPPGRGARLRLRPAGALVPAAGDRRSTCWPRSSRCAGFLGYVLVYTMWLKRSTPQNIVIGGAAGAVPPLVGWAAVTGHVDPTAWYLFAIVFYWTPPHFWALSLLMKDEYARVGVPMMPVVHGEAETRRQIVLYTCLLVVLTMLPVVFGFFGAIYAAVALGARRRVPACSRCACSAAPTARARCAPTCTRSPTWPCCSARWSPTPACKIRAMDRRLARRNLRTAMITVDHRPADVRADLRRRAALRMSELEHRPRPARRRGGPHAGAERDPGRSTRRRWRIAIVSITLSWYVVALAGRRLRRRPRSGGSRTCAATSPSSRSSTITRRAAGAAGRARNRVRAWPSTRRGPATARPRSRGALRVRVRGLPARPRRAAAWAPPTTSGARPSPPT